MKAIDLPIGFEKEVLFSMDGFSAQLCCSAESLTIAQQLRYQAYVEAGLIPENGQSVFLDSYDTQSNTRTHLIWQHGVPIATVRSNIWSADYSWETTEGITSFWQDVHRKIGLEKTIIESNRFATAPHLSGRDSLRAQIFLFRVQDLNAQYEQCEHIITAVREKHVPFYQRMLAFRPISAEQYYPWLNEDVVLLATGAAESRSIIQQKGMPMVSATEVQRYADLVTAKRPLI
ncbi:MAG: hypothetical protein AAFU60_14380 [Bacteroidota bacterium]